MIPAAVIVLFNGAIVASSPPAQLVFGHVMAPLAPVVTRFADRAALDGDTIEVVRAGRACLLRIGSNAMVCDGIASALPVAPFGRDGVAFVPLADIARAFDGDVTYDARAHAAAIELHPGNALRTPRPFDAGAPQAAPTAVFTPSPPPATPRAFETGSPLPRRTAIPVVPSRAAETTNPRP